MPYTREKTFVEPDTVVHHLVKDAQLRSPENGRGGLRDEVHEPLF